MIVSTKHTLFVVLHRSVRLLKRVSDAKTLTSFFLPKRSASSHSTFSYPLRLPIQLFRRFSVFLKFVYVRPTSRIGLKAVGAQNCWHHRGRRGLLSLLQASDPKSDDFSARNAKKPRKRPNGQQLLNNYLNTV